MTKTTTIFCLILSFLLFGLPVRSQTSETDAEETDANPPEEMPPNVSSQDSRLEALERTVAEQQKELAKQNETIEELKTAKDDEELDDFDEELIEEGSFERLIKIYGFFDIRFIKNIVGKDSSYYLVTHEPASFIAPNLNLYIDSQMTENLSALGEVVFSFLPHGYERDFEMVGADGQPVPGTDYSRDDTTVINPNSLEFVQMGGVRIERLHLTYSPFDWLQMMAGHYLTPFGIWNVDHGSTVVITSRVPYMQIREVVPRKQTGVQVFGRFFPTDSLFLDYAVTLSNGRGPIDAIADLDENKGVGLKLKMTYEWDRASLALGGYGYYGEYTDVKKSINIAPSNPDLIMEAIIDKTEAFDEYIVSADLRLTLFGFLLQSEFVWRYTHYTIPTTFSLLYQRLLTPEPGYYGTHYAADFQGMSVYLLGAWELPLSKWLGDVRISPYVMYEYAKTHETFDYQNGTFLFWGLNIKPSSFVVIKLEPSVLFPANTKMVGGNAWHLEAQIAVFF
ncbi:MAG: hypothetical protein GY847_28215 [Proteobacteria bacterium]|nr:hypothetical protein [Pseudomonadota bacterium]